MHDHDKKSGGCMACSCPCDMHKEHAHHEKEHYEDRAEGACAACSGSGDDKKHTCGC